MCERYVLAAAARDDAQQRGPVELVEWLLPDEVGQRGQAERFPQCEQTEEITRVCRHLGETEVDQLAEARGVGQGAAQPPDPLLRDQPPRRVRTEHELAEEQQIAAATHPQRLPCRGFDRPAQREVQQRVDVVTRQVLQVDAQHVIASPELRHRGRSGVAGANGSDEEYDVGVEQLAEQRHRCGIETVHVVDEQHERPGSGRIAEMPPRPSRTARPDRSAVRPLRPATAGSARPATHRRRPRSRPNGRRSGPARSRPRRIRPPGGSCRHRPARGRAHRASRRRPARRRPDRAGDGDRRGASAPARGAVPSSRAGGIGSTVRLAAARRRLPPSARRRGQSFACRPPQFLRAATRLRQAVGRDAPRCERRALEPRRGSDA